MGLEVASVEDGGALDAGTQRVDLGLLRAVGDVVGVVALQGDGGGEARIGGVRGSEGAAAEALDEALEGRVGDHASGEQRAEERDVDGGEVAALEGASDLGDRLEQRERRDDEGLGLDPGIGDGLGYEAREPGIGLAEAQPPEGASEGAPVVEVRGLGLDSAGEAERGLLDAAQGGEGGARAVVELGCGPAGALGAVVVEEGLLGIVGGAQRPEVGQGGDPAGPMLEGGLVGVAGLVGAAEISQGVAPAVVGLGVVRLELQRVAEGDQRVVVAARGA